MYVLVIFNWTQMDVLVSPSPYILTTSRRQCGVSYTCTTLKYLKIPCDRCGYLLESEVAMSTSKYLIYHGHYDLEVHSELRWPQWTLSYSTLLYWQFMLGIVSIQNVTNGRVVSGCTPVRYDTTDVMVLLCPVGSRKWL